MKEKRKADKEKFIKSFDEDPEVQILNGRWGPYISYQKKNYKIPKDTDPTKLSFDDCQKLIKNGGKKPVKKAATKKTATKKTATKVAAKKTSAKKSTKK
ncbi:topoisomerase C-terminal repeat-containing protein [Saccharicrinis fermentans]|uniref:DNA topoisomerase I n=1 Tax=Saccharicrinis fermentans DSM 9555 = JCM 21142 TaxID=869213 RepID=W7XY03_9BACT|nr:topoisomerase C-terminal repeat-containing protein [Saccharicrinis fermentans]GAF03445.1 DNA topoisomerase I [Saccharicrinis fermentans DSM 9555 = JCM 21142]